MLGGIYTDQRCTFCDKRFKDDRHRGLFCPNHPNQQASRFKVIFKTVQKRFSSYDEAQRFLTGLRFKHDEGTYDSLDYKREQPLAFNNLKEKWLSTKTSLKRKSYNNLSNYMNLAADAWGDKHIKNIDNADIEDFLLLLQGRYSGKTLANIRSCLHDFWKWVCRRHKKSGILMPDFPEISFSLGYRKIIGKDTQKLFLDEIEKIAPYRAWLGIKWLCTYISIRPGELHKILEEDFDLENRYILIRDPKPKNMSRRPVPILDEDIEIIKELRKQHPAFPKLRFFRHTEKQKGVRLNQPYGEKYLYKWWKRAGKNLGIQDVDLYGGTRHSSAVALRKNFSPEQIKQGTMHQTNKAFERYFRIESDDVRDIYAAASPSNEAGKKVERVFRGQPKS